MEKINTDYKRRTSKIYAKATLDLSLLVLWWKPFKSFFIVAEKQSIYYT